MWLNIAYGRAEMTVYIVISLLLKRTEKSSQFIAVAAEMPTFSLEGENMIQVLYGLVILIFKIALKYMGIPHTIC